MPCRFYPETIPKKAAHDRSIQLDGLTDAPAISAEIPAFSATRSRPRPLPTVVPAEVADQGRIRMGAGFRLPTIRG